jgi:serine O-acetyltransferase
MSVGEFLTVVRKDFERSSNQKSSCFHIVKSALLHPPFAAAFLHRIASGAYRLSPVLGRCVGRVNHLLHGADIDPRARIGAGLLLQHPVGVVIGASTEIGKNATLMSGVVLGRRDVLHGPDHGMYPVLGDDVLVGAHAVLLGAISVGNGARIGAQSLVLRDVSDGSTVVGSPARAISERTS